MDPLYIIGFFSLGSAVGAGTIAAGASVAVTVLNGRQRRQEREEDRKDRQKVADDAAAATQRAEAAALAASAHAHETLEAITQNTALTQQIEVSTNSMKDALILAASTAADFSCAWNACATPGILSTCNSTVSPLLWVQLSFHQEKAARRGQRLLSISVRAA